MRQNRNLADKQRCWSMRNSQFLKLLASLLSITHVQISNVRFYRIWFNCFERVTMKSALWHYGRLTKWETIEEEEHEIYQDILTATKLSLTSFVSRWLLTKSIIFWKSKAVMNPEPDLSNWRNASIPHSSWKSWINIKNTHKTNFQSKKKYWSIMKDFFLNCLPTFFLFFREIEIKLSANYPSIFDFSKFSQKNALPCKDWNKSLRWQQSLEKFSDVPVLEYVGEQK